MFEDNLKLTTADFNAMNALDADYLLDKGANFYNLGEYGQAVEYYRLAAMLGNVQAIANLGYCYLYGRQIKANLDLALAYFKVAAQKENIDAAYKLGDIYGSTKWGIQDDELSNYYYRQAVNFILGKDSEKAELLVWHHELQEYPSLCFALGRQKSKNGKMLTNCSS
ncbi:tetratricopeptide repeat protein [Ligilactobacillus apodemi]|uniref:Sel1 repeat family protein n=2 Tax=Ligilactobacillus TaxID=2767887 RepID=A0A0R1TPM8_9LACO|nr:tetratricopeptide repeat protein [Ligilactobacillus apodemi]KRL83405.1 hypothetical protein FC32_GL000655 [Ligilactobacillus apodemi DSM 16634 = JCM 16172]